MSSILDALRKVEAERAARETGGAARPDPSPVSAAPPAGMDPKAAEAALEHPRRRRARRHAAPWMYLLGGAAIITAMLTVSVVLALKLAGAGNNAVARQTTEHSTPAAASPALPPAPAEPSTPPPAPESVVAVAEPPAPQPESQPAPEAAPATPPAPAPVQPTVSIPVPPQVASQQGTPTVVTVQFTTGGPAPAPAPAPPVEPASAPLAVDPEPAPEPVRTARAAPAPAPAAPDPEPAAPKARPIPNDIRELPALRETEKRRYGLENMTINMLKEPSPDRPYAHAIINMEKVYVGERIAGSEATLIAVRGHGIAVEIGSTGARYYYED